MHFVVRLERGNGRRSAELCNSVCDTHPFSKRQDADFSLEDVDVDFEKYVSRNLLFCVVHR
jgi:hypothetical protein